MDRACPHGLQQQQQLGIITREPASLTSYITVVLRSAVRLPSMHVCLFVSGGLY